VAVWRRRPSGAAGDVTGVLFETKAGYGIDDTTPDEVKWLEGFYPVIQKVKERKDCEVLSNFIENRFLSWQFFLESVRFITAQ